MRVDAFKRVRLQLSPNSTAMAVIRIITLILDYATRVTRRKHQRTRYRCTDHRPVRKNLLFDPTSSVNVNAPPSRRSVDPSHNTGRGP